MNVTLTPESEQFIKEKVASGDFSSVERVIDEGIKLLREEELWRQEIRQKIDEGWNDAKAGRLLTPEQVKENMARRKEEFLARRPA